MLKVSTFVLQIDFPNCWTRFQLVLKDGCIDLFPSAVGEFQWVQVCINIDIILSDTIPSGENVVILL